MGHQDIFPRRSICEAFQIRHLAALPDGRESDHESRDRIDGRRVSNANPKIRGIWSWVRFSSHRGGLGRGGSGNCRRTKVPRWERYCADRVKD